MSISNHSVDRRASTADLEAQLEGYEESLNVAYTDGYTPDEAYAEWLESGIELIEAELAARTMEAELPAHDDSLDDRGLYLGSYAS